MIKSLYQIGKEISAGRDPWEDILAGPKINSKDLEKSLYVLPIEFNLDKGEVKPPEKTDLAAYSLNNFNFLREVGAIKIQGGNNKSIYLATDAGKLIQLSKTLFGKKQTDESFPPYGEFIEAIEKEASELKTSLLYAALRKVPDCRTSFFELFQNEKDKKDKKDKISVKLLEDRFELSRQDKIILVYATVSWVSEGLKCIPFAQLGGYIQFMEKKFFQKNEKAEESTKPKLCYATGEMHQDVEIPQFSGRYNMNKVFVRTTKNFAPGFNKKVYGQSYQLSKAVATYLDRGSSHILEKITTEIAGYRHAIIPEFFGQHDMRIQDLAPLKEKSDLLFIPQVWQALETYLEYSTDREGIYSVSFFSIDSDGNYFKVGNQVRDVSTLHLSQVLAAVKNAGSLLRPWLTGKFGFNLYSVYKSIPVRKDKESVNVAFKLFQAILEQKPIERRSLFGYFKSLILCHYYERYRAYSNITPSNRDQFAFSIRDAVFKYLALIEVLNQLELIEPSKKKTNLMDKTENIGAEVEAFLERMTYSEDQKALFHLGRALNRVVYEQSGKKGHKKNALDKLNYNGMDKQSIYRLANELFEISRHYNITQNIQWDWGRFSRAFRLEGWEMDPQEALFYILSGYAYGIKTRKTDDSTDN